MIENKEINVMKEKVVRQNNTAKWNNMMENKEKTKNMRAKTRVC